MTRKKVNGRRKSGKGAQGREGRVKRIPLFLVMYAVITGTFLITGAILLNRFVMPMLVMRGVEATVPDLHGVEFAEAAKTLRDAGFRARSGGEEPHATIREGLVVRQHPPGGSPAKPSRAVTLFVSSGPAHVIVPDLSGIGCREALATMTALGLDVGDIVMIGSERASVGEVVATTPSGGSRLVKGEPIDILVAGPPRAACYVMPDLAGRPVGDVFSELRRIGIGISKRMYVRGLGGNEGMVLSIFPPQGFQICAGESVAVAVKSS
jgi:beta-lactam-binding protein with PASTA domain